MERSKLEVKDLSIDYPRQHRVIFNLSFQVDSGKHLAILGPNGAGKSSLMCALAGVLHQRKAKVSSGKIFFDGVDITDKNNTQRFRAGLALVPEGRAIFSPLTVKENLQTGLLHHLGSTEQKKRQLEAVIEIFDLLKPILEKKVGLCSGGEQQVVSLARALVAEPKILLLDEPGQGLAPIIINSMLKKMAHEFPQLLMIIVEHNLSLLKITHDMLILEEGKKVNYGPTQEMLGANSPVLENYFGVH